MKLIRQSALYAALIFGVLLPVSAVWSAGLPHTFSSGSPANADEVNANFRYVAPENVVHVNPVAGGTATDNGVALLKAVDPAILTAINGAPTSSNRYLIKLAPGSYNTGGSPVVVPNSVYLEGSGKGVSWVTSSVSSATSGTIVPKSASAIRHLTVQNIEGSTGIAIYADNVTTLVEQVDIVIGGGAVKAGLVADNGAELITNNVRVRGFPAGNLYLYGVAAYRGSTLKLNNATVEILGGSTEHMAADINNSTAILHDVQFAVNNFLSSGEAYGLRAHNGSTVSMQNARLEVKGGLNHYPLWVANPADVTVQHSDLLSGSGNNGKDLDYFLYITGGSVKLATSRLASNYYLTSGSDGTESVTCAYIYDTEFNEATCNESVF